MRRTRPPHSEQELTQITTFFAAFGIPTEHMRASPVIALDNVLRFEPEFIWRVEDLTDEQLDAIEKTLRVELERS